MRILVTGATGFVGRHLLPRLRQAGNEVVVLGRGQRASDSVYAAPADLADLSEQPPWPKKIDAIVHLAALIPSRKARADESAIHRANAAGTAALARRAAKEGVKHVVFLSTASVHGDGGDEPISEATPLNPANAYARSKREAETVFWQALHMTGTQGCVLRPVPVFGEGGGRRVGILIKLASTPLPLPLRGLGAARSIIAVEHLVEAIMLCLTSEKAAGETFLVADDPPLSPADIVAAVRESRGKSRAVWPAPVAVFNRLAGALGKSDVWRAMQTPFVVDASHIRNTLGWSSPNVRSTLRRAA